MAGKPEEGFIKKCKEVKMWHSSVKRWRFIDIEIPTPYVKSFEGLEAGIKESVAAGVAPNTVYVLHTTPENPNLYTYYYTDPEKDVNLNFCREHNIVVVRTKRGGGPAYWADSGFLACGSAFSIKDIPDFPQTLPEIYRVVITKLSEKLNRAFGLNTFYRPLNDLEAAPGKKLGGYTGTFEKGTFYAGFGPNIKEPNWLLMEKAMVVPTEKFADKEVKSLKERIVWLEQLLGREVSFDEVKKAYAEAMEEVFDIELETEDFSEAEKDFIKGREQECLSDDWFLEMTEGRKFGQVLPDTKRGMHIIKVPQGPMIRCVALTKDDIIVNLSLTGSMHCTPLDVVKEIEHSLKGAKIDREEIKAKVEDTLSKTGGTVAYCEPSHFADVIIGAAGGYRK
jgi:lipoate-protein ligase A